MSDTPTSEELDAYVIYDIHKGCFMGNGYRNELMAAHGISDHQVWSQIDPEGCTSCYADHSVESAEYAIRVWGLAKTATVIRVKRSVRPQNAVERCYISLEDCVAAGIPDWTRQ